jgi:exopolysaccharide biosynthesis protein
MMISGAPDLVINGKISTAKLPPGFTDSRFTTVSANRTAIGVKKDGLLLLVSIKNVKISELKEIMLKLGCVNAINLDGGASSGMYYDGKVVTKPGRKLATLLYVYRDTPITELNRSSP